MAVCERCGGRGFRVARDGKVWACADCEGTGATRADHVRRCPHCDGQTTPLGVAAGRLWSRCEDCGMDSGAPARMDAVA